MARCVSSLLTTPVLGSPVQCERLPTLLHCVPADDACLWLSTYYTHRWPTSPPLMVFIFSSSVHSADYVNAYHSKRAIFVSQSSVSMTDDIYLFSSPPPVLVVTI
ncbi:hypothetical protein EDB84DRAFT_1495351 [Lactarius hengduanensis]|nr:hypothetical protein EDB84DRAFT_1495351 [Lactarius hengduanensis]